MIQEERPEGDGRGEEGGEGDLADADRSLPAGDLERVIRRAADLQHSAGEGPPDLLPDAEILRIGREVGLEPRHVRRALAEVRAEALVPDRPHDSPLLRAVVGEKSVRAGRVVPGARAEVQRRIETHFRERESLEPVRIRPGRSLWEPRGGLLDKMQRALDVGGRGYELAEARSVELAASELEEGWSLVTLTADLENVRRDHAVGWLAGSFPFFLGGAVVASATAGLPWEILVASAGGATAGAAAWGAGWSYGRRRDRVRLVLEGLLDRLEQGLPLEPERPSWRDKLMG